MYMLIERYISLPTSLYIVLDVLELTMSMRLASNTQSSIGLGLPSSGNTGMYNHGWQKIVFII